MEILAKPKDAAEVLQVPIDRIWSFCRTGVLPPGVAVKVGRQWRVNLSALQRWIDQGGDAGIAAEERRGK